MLPKVGIFGTSALASALISELQYLSFEIVGLWDQKRSSADAWSLHFNIPFATDSIEVLLQNQEVDLVVICSPPYFHKEIATKALAAGKHVICEPPLGITPSDNAAIMEQALYYPSLLAICTFGFRFIPGIQQLKSSLRDGIIGKVNSFEIDLKCGPSETLDKIPYDWTCILQLCAGPLYSVVPQLVDLITFLSGEKAYTVTSTVRRFQDNPKHFKYDQHLTREDFVTWQMLLESNIPCTCVVNNNFPGRFDFHLTITGSDGCVVIQNDDIFVEKTMGHDRRKLGSLIMPKGPNLELGMRYDYRHPETIVAGTLQMCGLLKTAFEAAPERRCLEASIVSGAPSFRDGQYGRSVADAIKRSAETRKWTEVRIPVKKTDATGNLTVSLMKVSAVQK